MTELFSRTFLLLVSAIALANCASTPKYSQVKGASSLTPKPGKSMVLVYWDSSFFAGNAGDFNLYASTARGEVGRKLTSSLTKGKFYTIEADPGYLMVTVRHVVGPGSIVSGVLNLVYSSPLGLSPSPSVLTMWKKGELCLEVQPDQTYFINAHWLRGHNQVEVHGVTEEQAWQELCNCRWLNPN